MAAENTKGELLAYFDDIKKDSKQMMSDLKDMNSALVALKEKVQYGDVNKQELIRNLEYLRLKIGVLEEDEKKELNEADIAESLLSKLKKWVDQIV